MNILSEDDIQEILQSLENFKKHCNEPNKLAVPMNGKCFQNAKPENVKVSTRSVYRKGHSIKKQTMLRRFRSCDSLNDLNEHTVMTSDSLKKKQQNYSSTDMSKRKPSSRGGTEESYFCSSFGVSEDEPASPTMKAVPRKPCNKTLTRQYGTCDQNLLDVMDQNNPHRISIKLNSVTLGPSILVTPDYETKDMSITTGEADTAEAPPVSGGGNDKTLGAPRTLGAGASRWKQAAVAATNKPSLVNVSTFNRQCL